MVLVTALPSAVAAGLVHWAKQEPDRIAITDIDGSLTFAEAERAVAVRAAQIAASKPRTNANVAWLPLLVDRSLESALAVHAVIRAGQPFVPIDHAAPPARVRDILERIGSPDTVAAARAGIENEATDSLHRLVLDDSSGIGSDPQPVELLDPSFVVFTSGSTGRPKAVVRRWATFANRLGDQAGQQMCAPGAPWNAATMQPFTFSPGHRGLGAMALGRTMHIIDPSAVSAESLVRWFAEREINEATFSATLLRSILDATGGNVHLPMLRLVRLGSEASTWDLVEPIWRIAAPDVVISAGYSASEIGRTFRFEIRPGDTVREGRIPLGRPLDAPRVRLEPVDGDASVTQLVIRTDESMGYLDDPVLTAARYRTDEHGGLWWLSGDIAVVDDEGVYHHRGRIDDMVKINGLLVEPAETERALAAVPGIAHAAVLPQQRSTGAWRLVAHLVVSEPALTAAAVLQQLRAALPRHLVPAVLVRHEMLPFNERNKLDRARLRDLPIVRWRDTPAAPIYDETTRWIAARIGAIVEVHDVGAHEDIWDLGLDSLAAVELCAAIADAGLGEIEPPRLVEARTPALIAEAIRHGRPMLSPVVTLNPNGTHQPLFVVPGGGGTALAFRSLANELGAEQPLVIVEPRGLHQRIRPDRSITAMARRVADEARARSTGPVDLIGYSSGATIAFEAAHQLIRSGYAVRLVFLDATVRGRGISFDSIRKPTGSLDAGSWQSRRNNRTLLRLAIESPAIAWRLLRRVRRRVGDRVIYRPWRRGTSDGRQYERFGALIGRASNRYRATPLPAHITVIESEAVGRGERTRPLASSVSVMRCSGDHFSMLEPPHVAELADLLRSLLR